MIFSRCQLYKGKADFIRKNRTPTQKSIKSWKKPLNMTLLDMHIGIFMRGIEWRCYFCKILNSKGRKIELNLKEFFVFEHWNSTLRWIFFLRGSDPLGNKSLYLPPTEFWPKNLILVKKKKKNYPYWNLNTINRLDWNLGKLKSPRLKFDPGKIA